MARNEEKANAVLNRFWEAKQEEKRGPRQKRPYLATDCRDLADADKWRQQILREIGRKVSEIQNPGLGEHRLRDLNDEINKLIREKGHWEDRIVDLGGPNYPKISPNITDADGTPINSASGKGLGYRYFGAAKELPGVKELFEKPRAQNKKRNRHELFKRIDMDYYGYRDEEDGLLERLESVAERQVRDEAAAEWERIQRVKEEARKNVKSGEEASVLAVPVNTDKDGREEPEDDKAGEGEEEDEEDDREQEEEDNEQGAKAEAGKGGGAVQRLRVKGGASKKRAREFVAHVPLPDEKEIERMVLAKKKAELLSRYASDALVQGEQEAKDLLNIKD